MGSMASDHMPPKNGSSALAAVNIIAGFGDRRWETGPCAEYASRASCTALALSDFEIPAEGVSQLHLPGGAAVGFEHAGRSDQDR